MDLSHYAVTHTLGKALVKQDEVEDEVVSF